MVHLDKQRMTQALLNLLSNAVKFTPRGGRIELIAEEGKWKTFVIRINDNGLGLPLARRLVELHQGTLKVESELGKGTTVILTLPPHRWHSMKSGQAFQQDHLDLKPDERSTPLPGTNPPPATTKTAFR